MTSRSVSSSTAPARFPGFTKKYNCERLVWFERFENIHDARIVERRMKAWKREWKVKRIEALNPEWRDLFDGGPLL